jgi:hypothetical protein
MGNYLAPVFCNAGGRKKKGQLHSVCVMHRERNREREVREGERGREKEAERDGERARQNLANYISM